MTLPLTRDFTSVDGVSQLPAPTFDRVQDGIVGVYTGTKSVSAISVDGAGNNAVTPPALLDVRRAALSDIPSAVMRDQAGNIRSLFDHNGYPMGRRCEFRQDWGVALAANDGRMRSAPAHTINNASSAYPTCWATEVGGTATGTDYYVATALEIVHTSAAFLSFVAETEIAYSTIIATNTTLLVGLMDGFGLNTLANFIGFKRISGGTNWKGSMTGSSDLDLGLPPVVAATPTQRLRLELHGSTSPYGSGGNGKARFFINEALVGEIVGAVPAAACTLGFAISIGGSAPSAGTTEQIGPFLATWNRALSLPAL